METPVPPPERPATTVATPAAATPSLINTIQSRIVSGLVLALPIVLTFWIVYWLYATLKQLVLDPTARVVRYLLNTDGIDTPLGFWWTQVASPAIAMILVLLFLYFLGLVVRSRLHLSIDWVMSRVPVVTTIYKGLSNVFQSLGEQWRQGNRCQRIVLVEFPHPGTRSLAFVTNTLQDATTGRTILSVCVLTGVMPPAGFTLFVPEESVVDVDWSVNQALQAIVSGGITAPAAIHFFEGVRPPGASGPIVDPQGHPIERAIEPQESAPA